MSESITLQRRILNHFSTCEDPRVRPVQYPLLEIIVTTVLATLCGEEGWEGFADWGQDKLSFLKRLLPFQNGIPSPDTFRRVFERLNPELFLKCFISWAQELKQRTGGQICIDGKTLRHAMNEEGPLHIVSAWSEANRMVLGSLRTASKSNEITAIQDLLDVLTLKEGDIITIDAIGCQKSIVSKIKAKGADYLIALKKKQYSLASEVENFFDQATAAPEYASCTGLGIWRDSYGRDDKQEVWVSSDVSWLPQLEDWEGLRGLVMVRRCWKEKDKIREEKRYYITSLVPLTEQVASLIRRHWSVENELHWHLDVTFGEDDSQIGPEANENLRVIRMTALDMLREEKTYNRGLKAKMRRCLRSEDYLNTVLKQGNF